MEQKFVDIFPTLDQPYLKVLSSTSLDDIRSEFIEKAIPFIPKIRKDGTRFRWKEEDADTTQHLEYTFNKALIPTHRIENIPWKKIDRRFRENPRSPPKKGKNADLRLGWRCENMFLVKSFFTFGLRKPPIGYVDVIETTDAPMLLYCPKTILLYNILMKLERSLPIVHENSFICYQLKPNEIYVAEKTYMLVAVQKSLFALTRMKTTRCMELKKELGLEFGNADLFEKKPLQKFDGYNKMEPSIYPTKWDIPMKKTPVEMTPVETYPVENSSHVESTTNEILDDILRQPVNQQDFNVTYQSLMETLPMNYTEMNNYESNNEEMVPQLHIGENENFLVAEECYNLLGSFLQPI